jgi:IMP dehydrogenase
MPDDEFFRLAEKYNNKVYYSVGAWHNDRIRIEKLLNLGIRNFCVDIAHGHSYLAGATVERIKELNKKATVIAGNVATLDGVLYLSKCGADIVKIGVGPGSICSTRTQTGVGIPQLTALLECSKAGVMLIADGGFKTPGDIAKALAIENVEGVMTGSMFAGTDKTPDWVDGGKTVYAGMASKEIQKRIKGKESNIEGISYNVECAPEGSTAAALSSILDGIRSALSYTGNGDLYEFRYNSRFIKVSSHTTIENSPHFKLWNK